MTQSDFKRLVIADPGLIDAAGHHLGYSWSVAEAAIGRDLPVLLLASARFAAPAAQEQLRCIPVFQALYQSAARTSTVRRLFYGLASCLPGRLGHHTAESLRSARRAVQRAMPEPDSFGSELAAVLEQAGGADHDLVLLHSASSANLDSLVNALRPNAIGALAVVLRRTPADMDLTDAAPRSTAVVLHRLIAQFGTRLRLFADTAELARAYAALTDAKVGVAPLPVKVPERHPRTDGIPHLVFAGGARAEKGYALLPPLVRQLAGLVRFTIHCGPVSAASDPVVQRAHRALRALAGPDLALIEHALPPDAYLRLIGEADLLLLPYDAAAYGPRSSGILAEARAMGIPATVPAGTWMESAAGPSSEVVFHGAADFIPIVERILRVLPALTARYGEDAAAWCRVHSPDALLRTLVDGVADVSADETVAPLVACLDARPV